MQKVKAFWEHKFKQPFRLLHRSEQVACIVVGALGGMFPIPMITTAITAIMCAMCSFSAPQIAVATAVNLLATPAEIVAIPYSARAASVLTGYDSSGFTVENLQAALGEGISGLISTALALFAHAVLTWSVLTIPIVALMMMSIRKNQLAKRHSV